MEYYFKYALTEEEYADYNLYTAWTAPWQKRTRMSYITRYLVYSLAGVAVIELLSAQNSSWDVYPVITKAIIITSVFGLIGITAWFQIANSIRSKAKKMIRKEENQHFLDETELTVSDDGILNVDKNTQTNYVWSSIVKYAVTKEYFYLYINSIQSLIVPKRLFKNEADIKDFDQFVSQKIPLIVSFHSIK